MRSQTELNSLNEILETELFYNLHYEQHDLLFGSINHSYDSSVPCGQRFFPLYLEMEW